MQEENENEKKEGLSDVQLDEVSKLFKILSEPARLRLISILMSGGLTVGEMVDATGLKQGNVSKHMKILLDAELVRREKEGNYVRYTISEPLLFEMCQLVCVRAENVARSRLDSLS